MITGIYDTDEFKRAMYEATVEGKPVERIDNATLAFLEKLDDAGITDMEVREDMVWIAGMRSTEERYSIPRSWGEIGIFPKDEFKGSLIISTFIMLFVIAFCLAPGFNKSIIICIACFLLSIIWYSFGTKYRRYKETKDYKNNPKLQKVYKEHPEFIGYVIED